MSNLEGRRALVTGAGQGIGAGISEVLAEHGATVLVNDLYSDRATAVAARIGGTPLLFDVTDLDAVCAAVADVGPIDILVNNAGIPATGFPQQEFIDSSPEQWKAFVDLNLFGVLNCTYALLPAMCEAGWGRVVTIASEAGRIGLPLKVALYGAAKAGAISLMKHLAYEVGQHGVTCNALALGAMDNTTADPRRIPVPRLGRPRDAGQTVAFLCSDGAEWITGQVIGVNGGAVT